MTINSEQIQALKAAAIAVGRDGRTDDEWFHYLQCVHYKFILSLLAERDADKALIAEQVKQIDELEDIRAASERLVRCKGRYHSEQNYRALAALFGVSAPDLPPLDSEARTVTVKLPERQEPTSRGHYGEGYLVQRCGDKWPDTRSNNHQIKPLSQGLFLCFALR